MNLFRLLRVIAIPKSIQLSHDRHHVQIERLQLNANNTDLKYTDRQTRCRNLIDRLDQRLGSDFYDEFSASMNIEALIKAVEARSQQ